MKNDYYEPVTRGYRSLSGDERVTAFYFDNEPSDGEPNHKRVLSMSKFIIILSTFVSRLILDVYRNSKFTWKRGTVLPNKNAYLQPLGDDEVDTVEF
jgi:hypothetical protein